MANEYYEVPGGLVWCKANLKIVIGNTDLAEIMNFGDLWRSRGHRPLVHVVSPAMDNGKMWDKHKDPSGLIDNIPSHIDMFIVDFFNLETPQLPNIWEQMAPSPQWLLWEYKSGLVRFNGSHQQFVNLFKIDPATTPIIDPGTEPVEVPASGGVIHVNCPHCGKLIF